MLKLLIISPRFPPINAPDHQRVRMSLPYFREFGWEPTVMCVTADTSDSIYDPLIERSVPSDIRVLRVPAWSEQKCRRLGFGHLDYRCLIPLYRSGTRLLSQEKFDLVFFSTTVFTTFVFARLWKRRFNCPIVFDFQDPWFAGTDAIYETSTPPGGRAKYRISLRLAQSMEPFAMRAADFVVAVSDGYVRALRNAYEWLRADQFAVLPFGAAESDFELLSKLNVSQSKFDSQNGRRHIVYVGRGGPDMDPILEVLFRSLAELREREPRRWENLHFHFVGTNYSPKEKTYDMVRPLAEKYQVGELVSEHSERIPYFEALKILRDSSGVLLLGSTAPEYTASKFFSSLLSGRPVFALGHSQSLVTKLATQYPDVLMASFEATPSEEGFRSTVMTGLDWLEKQSHDRTLRQRSFRGFSACESTGRLCEVFKRVIAPNHIF